MFSALVIQNILFIGKFISLGETEFDPIFNRIKVAYWAEKREVWYLMTDFFAGMRAQI